MLPFYVYCVSFRKEKSILKITIRTWKINFQDESGKLRFIIIEVSDFAFDKLLKIPYLMGRDFQCFHMNP